MSFGRCKGTLLAWICLLLIAPSVVRGERLPTTIFTARDGIAPTVHRIVVDSKGFIWFVGSELARFDGNAFRVFTEADGAPISTTSDILERRDGTYWVAAEEQLCTFDPRPNRPRFQCERPKLGDISALLQDESTLWCGTDTGLWRRPANGAKPWQLVRAIEPGPTGRPAVYRLLKDTRGDVWATTVSGLYRLRSNGGVDHWTPDQGLVTDPYTALSETPGAVWAGSGTELMRFEIDPNTGEARIADRQGRAHGLPSGYTENLLVWRGSVWAATFQGLARQLPSGRWEAVELDAGMNGLPVGGLNIDHLGNMWLGISGGGVARISALGFSSFSERDGLGVRGVWAVFEDRQGNLTAVTKDEGHYFLNRFDGYRFHRVRPNLPFDPVFGWSWSQIAVHSRTGDWWLATGAGLLRYTNQLEAAPIVQGPEVGLATGNVFCVFEDSGGAVWTSIGNPSGIGLYRRNPRTGRFERFDESHGLPTFHQTIRPAAFAEDRTGQIWIGMLDGGLVRFRNGTFQQFPASSGAPDQGVRALLVDRQGRLWIGSRRRGLLRVDDPSKANPVFSAYTKSSGLSSMVIAAMAEDLDGRIYVATGSGIDRLDPATGRIRTFTTADGVLPAESRVGFRDRHGALWFGGDNGLVRLEPQKESTDSPVVLVHSIRVNGHIRPISDLGEAEPAALSLSPSERQVQVDFGGFRHDLLYQTRLSGVDPDWTPPSSSRSVHYLSLASGNYELRIRAVTPEGGLSSSPATVRFRVAPPLWQRWWFLFLATFAAASAAYAVYRYRVSTILEVAEMRTRIATDLHDDIGANLTKIAILSEVARQRLGESEDSTPLVSIARIARESVSAMSDIVWAINPKGDSLLDVVRRMRRHAEEVFAAGNVSLAFAALETDGALRVGISVRRDLFLIFKEAVNNAARHARCTHVAIDLRAEGSWLELRVIDDGAGFDAAAESEGQGLASIRRRAEKMGGKIEVESHPGHGTSVRLRVPCTRPRAPLRSASTYADT
jgi:ligand-binding sensor domain-containing protein/two-component sensor histidine kinase